MKPKESIIELEEAYQEHGYYRVTRLTNTVEFHIRQRLGLDEVEKLIDRDHTKVVVKPNRQQKNRI